MSWWRGVLCVGISIGLGTPLLASCGRDSGGGRATGRLLISFDREDLEGDAYGLTGETPAFVGLLAQIENGAVLSRTAITQNLTAELEVELGMTVQLNASIVSFRAGDPFLYVSQAAEKIVVQESTEEAVLEFTPYAAVRPINIYGVIFETETTPAAGAKVTLLDPVTGAPVFMPGESQTTVTNEAGAFAASFPVDAFGALNRVKLEITFAGQSKTVDVAFNRGTAPGVTLPFVNFAAGETMGLDRLPAEGDYDGDGSSNGFELAQGTNPFSELSGARGASGLTTLIQSTFDAAACEGRGGAILRFFLDTNGSLAIDEGDTEVTEAQSICAGPQGPGGPSGAQGNEGPVGPEGPEGPQLLKLYDDSGNEMLNIRILAISPDLSTARLEFMPDTAQKKRVLYQFPKNSGASYAPAGVRSSRQCFERDSTLSGGQVITECARSGLSWPFFLNACFFKEDDCSGYCYLSVKPMPHHIFAVNDTSAPDDYKFFATGMDPITESLSGGAFARYTRLDSFNVCQSYAGSSLSERTFYKLAPYTLPGDFPSLPLGDVSVR